MPYLHDLDNDGERVCEKYGPHNAEFHSIYGKKKPPHKAADQNSRKQDHTHCNYYLSPHIQSLFHSLSYTRESRFFRSKTQLL